MVADFVTISYAVHYCIRYTSPVRAYHVVSTKFYFSPLIYTIRIRTFGLVGYNYSIHVSEVSVITSLLYLTLRLLRVPFPQVIDYLIEDRGYNLSPRINAPRS